MSDPKKPANDRERIEPANPSTGPQKPQQRDDPEKGGQRHDGGHQREPGYDEA